MYEETRAAGRTSPQETCAGHGFPDINSILRRQLSQNKKGVGFVYALSFGHVAAALVLPWYLSGLVGQAAGEGGLQTASVLMSIGIILLYCLLFFLSGWLRENVQKRFTYSLQQDIWENNLYAKYGEYRKRDREADFQMVTGQSDELGNYYLNTLPGLFVSVLMTAGGFAGICFAGSGMGILPVFLVILICFMACLKLSSLVEKKHEISVDAMNQYVACLTKIMQEIRTVKLFVLYEKIRKKIALISKRVINSNLKKVKLEYLQRDILTLMKYLLLAAGVFCYVREENTGLEEFLVLEQYIIIFSGYLTSLIQQLNSCRKKKVIRQKLGDTLLRQEEDGTQETVRIRDISLDGITFSFEEDRPMYRDFTARFEMGKCYVIKAPNGFGKTTLFELMTGIERPSGGTVRYNGTDISRLDMNRLRRGQICYLMQSEFFHRESLQANIDSYLDGVSAEELRPYLEMLKLDTEAKEGDFNTIFSGGQKKKLAFAIMMKKASLCRNPVVFLDEPTNTLDQETVKTVISYVEKIKENAMIFIISHDSSFDRIADKVVELNA